MIECVLFDKNGKEIDWYDPIRYVTETDTELIIEHGNNNIYKIPRTNYSSYVVRELKIMP